jgi:glycosyltransferase involved in cell wall biosynthesis
MKVLFVQHDGHLKGGTGQVLLQLSRGLQKFGVESVAILPEDGELRTALCDEGVKTFIVPAEVFSSWRPESGNWYLAGLSNRVAQYREIILNERVDIVHTNTIFVLEGALAAIQTNRPHVWHIHNNIQRDSVPAFWRALPIVGEARGQFLAWLADCIVAVSRDTAQSLEIANPVIVRVIHNGLDIETFDRRSQRTNGEDIRTTLGLDADVPLVGTVARVGRQKNLQLLVESAKLTLERVPQCHILIIGPPDDAAYAASLVRWVEEHGLGGNIHFLGGRSDIPSLIRQLDVFALSSDFEGFGLVILEAMAASKPVVATRCGGPEEIIVDGATGFLVDKDDVNALAGALTKILQNPSLATRMGRAGRERVAQEFSADVFAERFYSLYQSLQGCGAKKDHEQKLLLVEYLLNLTDQSARLVLDQKKLLRRVEAMEAYLDRFQSTLLYRVCNSSRKALRKLAGGASTPEP